MTEVKIKLEFSISVLENLIAQNEGSQDSYVRGVVFGYQVAVKEMKDTLQTIESAELPVPGCPF